MGTNVAPVSTPILQFLNNAGQPNVGGSLLTQVGGVNYPTYQDASGTTALPNPIPLNSRGEISNTSGVSVPLYLIPSVVYTFTLYDANNNVIWVDDNVVAQGATAVGQMNDELGSDGTPGFKAGMDFIAGTTMSLMLSGFYGTTANLWVAFDGVEQGANTYQLSGHTLTFGSYSGTTFTPGPIPTGTNAVFVKGGTTSSIGTPGAGTVNDSSVASDAGIQSTKLSFTGPWAGAVARTVNSKESDWISVRDFGAKGDGTTDDTLALNTAFTDAYAAGKALFFPSGQYMVREFSSGIGYAILNPGVSFFGEGMTHSAIQALPTMPSSANFMLIQPSSGAYLDFLFIRDMIFQPTNGSTKYGASCLYWNFQTSSNASCVNLDGVYCAPGNAYSMIWNNNGATNAQGIPAELVVERCAFWEGTQFMGGGDSNRFRDCTFRSNASSTRVGVQFNSVGSAGNAPSALAIQDCNFDCAGGAVTVFGSYQTSIRHNNIEMSAGAGSGSGACVDIDGSTVANSFPVIEDNLISIFGSSTATSGVRINVCEGAIIDKNRFLAGHSTNQAILVTANATDTYIGLNEIAANYTAPVTDLGGTGTRGIRKALTLQNGFSNGGGGFGTANAIKNKEGVVFLEGLLSNSGAPSGTVITTLPTGFIPLVGFTFIAYGVVGGVVAAIQINVLSNGNVQLFSTANVTSLSLNGISFNTNSYIISSN